MGHLALVLEKLQHNPKAFVGLVALPLAEKLVEHRALTWANDQLDKGAGLLIPQLQQLLRASSEHFWLSILVMVAAYSVAMVAVAHLSALLPNGWPWASRSPALGFGEWHAGGIGPYPIRTRNGTFRPSWISVRNPRSPVAEIARNVVGRIEWINHAGVPALRVPEVAWYEMQEPPGEPTSTTGWSRQVQIEAGDEQSFILYETDQGNRVWIYRADGDPVGLLDMGYWRAHIHVSSDNAWGFEGTLGFTLTRSGLFPDRPQAFVTRRRLRPNVRPA